MRIALFIAALAMIAGCATDVQRAAQNVSWSEVALRDASTSSGIGASTAQAYVVVTIRNMPAPTVRAGSTARDYDMASVYGPSPRARSDVDAIGARYGLRQVNAWPIDVLHVHCVVYALLAGERSASPTSVDEVLTRLRQDERVESAQPLNSFATLSSFNATAKSPAKPAEYSDPYFKLQNNLQVLDVPQAQRISRGAGVRIAVIDTGIDARHPELQGRVIAQRNFVGGAQRDEVPERHGTAVAGVIAAIDNNNLGIVGVAPGAQLISLRACWQTDASDARASCNTFTLAQALAAAIDLRADVVNLSLGGPADPLLDRLVLAGMQRGIVYVGAMAPDTNAARTMFPINIAGVIGVDSAEPKQSLRPALQTILAPGANILTLTPSGGYDFMSGSSLAAASVSGGIALMLGHQHRLQRDAIANALSNSSRATNSVDFCLAISELDRRASCTRD